MGNVQKDIAPLFGLVLMGGKSHRMGANKAELLYHEQAQYLHLYKVLDLFCENTFLSLNNSQSIYKEQHIKVILDNNQYAGPYNGLMSAYDAYPHVAWLVVACDLPFLGENELKALLQGRNPIKPATALTSTATGIPEPLICIWEPHGLQMAKAYMMDSGNISPKHFLIHSDAKRVFVDNEECLFNANTQEDFEFAKRKIDNSEQKE
jgi:molybdopterin-guanine dinucleotide biosynthesis protein A